MENVIRTFSVTVFRFGNLNSKHTCFLVLVVESLKRLLVISFLRLPNHSCSLSLLVVNSYFTGEAEHSEAYD